MRLIAVWALMSMLALGADGARAWGHQGHEVVGAIAEADGMLQAPARAQVQALLGQPLSAAATWLDCVKDVQPSQGQFVYRPDPRFHATCQVFETPDGIRRMEDYVARNWDSCSRRPNDDPCHKSYHYTDVAAQHDHYDRHYAGTSDHDIVSAMAAAIAVLQDRPAPAPFSIKDKAEALLMLTHLVGDVHQPLHVGALYLDAHGQTVNPDSGGHGTDPKTETRGGNSIDDGSTNLHAEWDTVPASLKANHLSQKILAAAAQVPSTSGDIATWPAAWAGETVDVSHQAFAGIAFKPSAAKPGHWQAEFADRPAYLAAKRNIQADQLAKAGARLAQLLNAIWP